MLRHKSRILTASTVLPQSNSNATAPLGSVIDECGGNESSSDISALSAPMFNPPSPTMHTLTRKLSKAMLPPTFDVAANTPVMAVLAEIEPKPRVP